MEILNRKKITNQEIESGEEALHQAYSIRKVDKTLNLLVGVDGGSTQTRCYVVDDPNSEEYTLHDIPSVASFVDSDIEIQPKGDNLYQQLDSTIIKQSTSKEAIFDKVRVVRGTKMLDYNKTEQRISSINQKIETPLFYINIVDAIGYAICQKYNGELPSYVKVAAGVALPPDDRNSSINTEKFFTQLIGKYTWEHKESGVQILIEIVGAKVLTEPEAFINGYHIREGEEFPGVELHVNMGGRSTGVELLIDGVLIDSASKTLPYGGTQLAENLGELLAKTRGGRAPQARALKKALETGFLKSGRSEIDITSEITAVKKEMAVRLKEDIKRVVFDMQPNYAPTDVEVFSVSGRTFEGGDYNVSIATFLQEEFFKLSEFTEFQLCEGNYIPYGLVCEVFEDFGGILYENPGVEDLDEEEELEDTVAVDSIEE